MDANGLRFWQLADRTAWPDLRHAGVQGECAALRLASERTLQPALAPAAAFAAAQAALDEVPRAVDALECVASWDGGLRGIVVHGPLPDDVLLRELDEPPSDLCVAHDGVLLAALAGRVLLHDLRDRWADAFAALEGFQPWRLAPIAGHGDHEGGGAWVLERGSGRVARLSGRPLRAQTPTTDMYGPQVFRPQPENACPPTLALFASVVQGASERVLAIADDRATGGPMLLCWLDGEGSAAVRCWNAAEARFDAPLRLAGAAYGYSLAQLEGDRIAVRVPGRRDAPAFDLAAADAARAVTPLGEVYPLHAEAREAPFCGGVREAGRPPHYPVAARHAEPLHSLSYQTSARRGEARNYRLAAENDLRASMIDSGDTTTLWHRLNAEAAIPPHCAFVVWLAATNVARPPPDDDGTQWHPHAFGSEAAVVDEAARGPQVPQAAWDRAPSELAGHPGLLAGERIPDRRGLFGVLVQASRRRVRNLQGRYLWLRVVLTGDGRASPEIVALRAWASRFSYVERYLPRVYRESLFGDAALAPGIGAGRIEIAHAAALDAGGPLDDTLRARLMLAGLRPGAAASVTVERSGQAWLLREAGDAAGAWRLRRESEPRPDGSRLDFVAIYQPQATPADFNARLVANFEGVLTQLEDRVAAAHLMSDPQAVPEPNLEWLGSWIGVAFDAALPPERRREWLRAAPELARRHGTRDGLRLALDVASGGGVRGGEIVVIEDFRLRRILATLLGVDMSDAHDPLLPGLHQSGNSIVGDTLFVGSSEGAELAALYADVATTDAEDVSAREFLGRLAYRATVLVHQEIAPQDFALIRRIAQLEAPAHVIVRVVGATWPLLVGIASLVGVDTYLGPPRRPRPVRVGVSAVGLGDRLIGPGVLDPRLAGNTGVLTGPPVADAGANRSVPAGASFELDGSASRAASGRRITEYRWRLLPPQEG
ncbi:phage tail protein [Variovorax sp. J22P168]|uniref:phage tail protein n=1 Tax=Variovorax jilinensis TaxID=3053513 RepID=UPI0025750C51|nr:phage tail protein [Variovorax sp. J22P168]MDM0011744.1 phage tail protein [Variovorax sp. J22P168]